MNSPFRFRGQGPADDQPPTPAPLPADAASTDGPAEAVDLGTAHLLAPGQHLPPATAVAEFDDGAEDEPAGRITAQHGHHRPVPPGTPEQDSDNEVPEETGSPDRHSASAATDPAEHAAPGGTHQEDPGVLLPEQPTAAGPSVQQNVGTNYGVTIGAQFQNIINGMRTVELRPGWVDQQLAVHVPPKNLDEARIKLRDEHVVVLIGENGAGREAAGLCLLRELGKDLTFKRFHREPRDPFSLADLTGQQNIGWILDLRAEGDTVAGGLGYSLQDTGTLKAATSYLVVLTSPQVWSTISDGSDKSHVLIEPADAPEVLRAHLALAGCQEPERWIGNSRIEHAIARKLPGEVKRWAEAIVTEEARPAPTLVAAAGGEQGVEEFRARVERVVEAMADWRNQLLSWHMAHPNSDHRNYLLAAAAMDGSPVELIYHASESLAKDLGEEPTPRPGQQGPGIIELTHMIGAELSAEATVTLPSKDYAEAVVEYFLLDRAHLVDRFTEWTAHQAACLPGGLGTQLADRVAVWVIRHTQKSRSVKVLKAVATVWSARPLLRGHARDLLSIAAVDSGVGRLVREQSLVWTRDDKEPDSLRATLAGVCQQVSQVYPKEALLRLGELAARGNTAVTAAVGEAINTMWERPDERQQTRKVLRQWARSSTESLRRSSSQAFLYLAIRTEACGTPSLLVAGAEYEGNLPWIVQSWRTALENDTAPDNAIDAFKVWMDHSAAEPKTRDAVFDILARAVHDAPEANSAVRFLSLNRLASHWEPSEPRKPLTERARFRDSLIDWVRAADPSTSRTDSGVSQP
ncbi:hypothetical protein [Kitasatospora sp. NPDC059673]|uniref:hypothetical protein n=1 Tax=Kitasatospora sp. NPDC059673 TaxID=3346901 RepID=UPI00367CEA03